jgi:hypothetical protein
LAILEDAPDQRGTKLLFYILCSEIPRFQQWRLRDVCVDAKNSFFALTVEQIGMAVPRVRYLTKII